jgi:hypothetical protein
MDALTVALDRELNQTGDDPDEIPANIRAQMQAKQIANLREVADELDGEVTWACEYARQCRETADELADAAAHDADLMTFEEWAGHWAVVDDELVVA